ncbi:ABC transporter permease [Acidiphilium sp. AL]|uniref:ABC transporter permease n=1 Tax=Acidiphilium iwatense TaxID=768198 RepID=A0ABS9E175_9PROT|nr:MULTISPECIES: ABC transporter permease [Acidiphilium]MCF3948155.1 ABC transporter permease [Acidiphilium iwatense]MCU4161536.1 ABC transporter permease [Acidiphilium sp. AL]
MTVARLDVANEPSGTVIALAGPLTAPALAPIWSRTKDAARRAKGALIVDLAGAEPVDTSGAALLLALEREHGERITLRGLGEQPTALLARLRAAVPDGPPPKVAPRTVTRTGLGRTLLIRVAFFGETILATLTLPTKLRFLRGGDFFRLTERAGTEAMPLILMMGFLIGMILAFQSAIPMRQFGADIYVAALVSLSLFRELGPLLAAVILAGRTGSAFAAELGTMMVNEEVAALTTMGIDAETMLVIPRMAAAMLVMPALAIGVDVAGIIGMGFVMMILGFPPAAILHQVQMATGPEALLLGLFKAVVFGAAIGLIGCRAGLTAGGGPRAVGEAATSAVVGGIVATILLDGLFAVIFYRLGL